MRTTSNGGYQHPRSLHPHPSLSYNDPDNVLGPHGTVGTTTQAQAETQFLLWSLFPAPIILGEDLTQATPEYLATVGNEELLAVSQDAPFAGPARRVLGGDLSWPCSEAPAALYTVQVPMGRRATALCLPPPVALRCRRCPAEGSLTRASRRRGCWMHRTLPCALLRTRPHCSLSR